MNADPTWKAQTAALGAFIRAQRAVADLSLREMATMTNVSNAYLSQVERGLHQPSLRVLRAIAEALHVPTDLMLEQAGLGRADTSDEEAGPSGDGGAAATGSAVSTVSAIMADPALTDDQRRALLAVYQSFVPPPPAEGQPEAQP